MDKPQGDNGPRSWAADGSDDEPTRMMYNTPPHGEQIYTGSQEVQPRSRFGSKSQKRGCLIGCAVVLVLMVAVAVAIGVFLKGLYDDVVGNDSNSNSSTSTTAVTNADAKPVDSSQYVSLLGGHLTMVQTQVKAVGNACKSVRTDKKACQGAVNSLHDELVVTQDELNTVKAPAELQATDTKLRDGVGDAITGTGNISEGLDNHPLTFAKGVIEVTRAGAKLQSVRNELGSVGQNSA